MNLQIREVDKNKFLALVYDYHYSIVMPRHTKHYLGIQFLFTWADGIVGKPGYVYQAANFYYGGFIWTDIYISADGEKIHPRSAKQLLKDNAEFEGKEKLFWLTPAYCKMMGIKRYRGKQFRYIYPMNKNAKKLLSSSTVKWNISNFPKDVDLVWKVQVAKGEYETTNEKPEFHKLSINVNRGNYDANFGKPSRRRTPLAPDKGDYPAQFSFFSPDVFPPIGDDTTPALCG